VILFSLRRGSGFDRTAVDARAFSAATNPVLQGLRFAVTGLSSYLFYVALFFVFCHVADRYASLTVAYITAAAAHFVASKYFTFLHQNSEEILAEIWKFALLLCVTTVVNWAAFYCANSLLHLQVAIALMVGIGASSVISFTVMRAWVFASK
jgi:putative flippase GtrA